jgi:o-succinylbenzoate---CoA ligase
MDPFGIITINNREVLLNDILNSTSEPRSAFEQHAFDFIVRWHSRADEFILQTSGSTGTPKTIRIRRTQMIASAAATAQALDLKRGDTAFICLDPKFIAGQMMFVRSFNTGLRIIATDPTSNPLAALDEKRKIDFTAVVPLQLDGMLLSPQRERLNNIGKIIVGGSAVSPEIIHRLDAYPCTVFATYGMTETISHIALRLLSGPSKSAHFTVLPGVKIDTDPRGCLRVEVPYLDQPVTTNDLVRIISPSDFEWVGRVDNVINTGGVKVSPEQIEHKLERSKAAISLHVRLVISSRPSNTLGEEVICILETERVDTELKETLKAEFAQLLNKFERPKDFVCVFPFPETETGKINRTALRIAVNRQHL